MIKGEWQQGGDVRQDGTGLVCSRKREKNQCDWVARAGEERKKSVVEHEVRSYPGRSCGRPLWCGSEWIAWGARAYPGEG